MCEAVAALGRPADLIGFHGQTILHQPDRRRTWQIGDAAGWPGAPECRWRTISVRRMLPREGEGAPLAPVYHAALARGMATPLAVLNIGGVANVTWIGADGRLVAFDTGPGNGPLDDWVARHTGAPFDRDGALAVAGTVDRQCWAGCWRIRISRSPRRNRWTGWTFRRACHQRPGGTVSGRWRGNAGRLYRRLGRRGTASRLRRFGGWSRGGGRHNPAIMAGAARRAWCRLSIRWRRLAGTATRWRRNALAFSRRVREPDCRSAFPIQPGRGSRCRGNDRISWREWSSLTPHFSTTSWWVDHFALQGREAWI